MFLERLKKDTAPYHRGLEASTLSVNLVSNHVTLHDYSLYLQKLHSFQSTFENSAYSQLSGMITDIDSRRKTGLLEKDLHLLNARIPGETTDITPTPSTILQWLGAFYVMEGSTIGGAIIARHLHKQLGSSVEGKTNYFEVYGKDLSAKWKSFLAILQQYGRDGASQDEIIKGANTTFVSLKSWFEKDEAP